MRGFRYFRRLDGRRCYTTRRYYATPLTMSIFESIEYGTAELLKRLAFTGIGAIMIWWAWTLISSQISAFPNVDWLTVLVALFTMIIGIRNALSIFRGLSWGHVFLTLLFIAVNVYLVWFA